MGLQQEVIRIIRRHTENNILKQNPIFRDVCLGLGGFPSVWGCCQKEKSLIVTFSFFCWFGFFQSKVVSKNITGCHLPTTFWELDCGTYWFFFVSGALNNGMHKATKTQKHQSCANLVYLSFLGNEFARQPKNKKKIGPERPFQKQYLSNFVFLKNYPLELQLRSIWTGTLYLHSSDAIIFSERGLKSRSFDFAHISTHPNISQFSPNLSNSEHAPAFSTQILPQLATRKFRKNLRKPGLYSVKTTWPSQARSVARIPRHEDVRFRGHLKLYK